MLSETSQAEEDKCHMWNPKNTTHKQAEQKQMHGHRTAASCQSEGAWSGWVQKAEGQIRTHWLLENSDEDVKSSIGNTASDTVIIMHGALWVLDVSVLDCTFM